MTPLHVFERCMEIFLSLPQANKGFLFILKNIRGMKLLETLCLSLREKFPSRERGKKSDDFDYLHSEEIQNAVSRTPFL
jgi:hypothetical protein